MYVMVLLCGSVILCWCLVDLFFWGKLVLGDIVFFIFFKNGFEWCGVSLCCFFCGGLGVDGWYVVG